MPDPAVRVEGARELSRAFRQAVGSTRDLSRAYREVGRLATDRSKSAAAGARPQQRKAAAALLGRGTSTEASVGVRNTGRVPFGIGAFMGARRWRQFPPWVGNTWDIASGSGPYVIADAVSDAMPDILDEFAEAIGDALDAAGIDADVQEGGFG